MSVLSDICHSAAMRNLWTRAGVFGSMSMAFGSLLWSQKKTEPDQLFSSCSSADANLTSPYELKLVQVLFRHGARTPLKSIPDVMEVRFFFCLSSTHLILVFKEALCHIITCLSGHICFIKGPVGANPVAASSTH